MGGCDAQLLPGGYMTFRLVDAQLCHPSEPVEIVLEAME
jgi:hypothetical protein